MASKLKVITADSLKDLVTATNEYLNENTVDARITVEIAGGVTFLPAEGYAIPLIITVPFKRTLGDED